MRKRHLDIDVSHPWDGKTPIHKPKLNPDTIPDEQEIIEVLQYFMENEPNLIISMLTEVEMDNFLYDGKGYNARIQRSAKEFNTE